MQHEKMFITQADGVVTTKHGRLIKLAAEIRDGYEVAEALKKQAIDKGNDTIREYILLGQKLIEAKELVKYGDWEKWVEENCGFTRMTANRYMRLSVVTHVLQDKPESIRKAYLLAGIIPDPEKKQITPQPALSQIPNEQPIIVESEVVAPSDASVLIDNVRIAWTRLEHLSLKWRDEDRSNLRLLFTDIQRSNLYGLAFGIECTDTQQVV